MLGVYYKFTKQINTLILSQEFTDKEKVYKMRIILIEYQDSLRTANNIFYETYLFQAEPQNKHENIIQTNMVGVNIYFSLN